jgi:hypothetical protein
LRIFPKGDADKRATFETACSNVPYPLGNRDEGYAGAREGKLFYSLQMRVSLERNLNKGLAITETSFVKQLYAARNQHTSDSGPRAGLFSYSREPGVSFKSD